MTREEKQKAIDALKISAPVMAVTQEEFNDYIHILNHVMDWLEQEPKTGHWIEHPEIETSTPEYLMFYECSECGDKQCFCKSDIHKKHFCNNCGARMVEPQESENKDL